MQKFMIFVSGLLFGAGLTLSGMVNPMKVLNFLDVTGTWDPTLLFVMAGGLIATFIGYRLIFRQAAPLFADRFQGPPTRPIDVPLLAGAALFGAGWGLAGFCPGPALASLVFGRSETLLFVVAMTLGMLLMRFLRGRPSADVEPSASTP